jgi:uncharacterized membrane protein (UPF0127 family)
MGKKSRSVRVQSLKNQAFIAEKCHVAECFVDRLRGLIGKTGLGAGTGMLFPRCNSVHMWFMSFPIDVVFLRQAPGASADAAKWIVSSAHESVRPWKALPLMDLRARDALELPAGTIRQARLSVGDELCIS